MVTRGVAGFVAAGTVLTTTVVTCLVVARLFLTGAVRRDGAFAAWCRTRRLVFTTGREGSDGWTTAAT